MRAVLTVRGSGGEVVCSALVPEAGREIPGARVTVHGHGDAAEVLIEAEGLPALRAALNSYLRWAQLALDVRKAARA